MTDYPQNISLEEAQSILLNLSGSIGTGKVILKEALGRVAAEDIATDENLPPFDRSPYDGYAFMSADAKDASKDNPVFLKVNEEIPAGHFPDLPVLPGEAAKILTGAPLPDGADTVVKYENVIRKKNIIGIMKPQAKGENVVYKGEDLPKGEILARKGTLITPPIIGLLASLGITEVPVYRTPKIALVSTGDELLEADQALKPGKIRNSNRHTIEAFLRQAEADTLHIGTSPDKADQAAALIKEGLRAADMVITTGGVSVGDYDILRFAAELAGAEILFWKMAIRPGGAVLAAIAEGKLILGLSGNPAAAILALHLLALPFIRILSGENCGMEAGDLIDVSLLEDFRKPSPVRRFIWGKLVIKNGEAYLKNTGRQGNAILHSLYQADLLGEIPAGSPPLKSGTRIRAFRIG